MRALPAAVVRANNLQPSRRQLELAGRAKNPAFLHNLTRPKFTLIGINL